MFFVMKCVFSWFFEIISPCSPQALKPNTKETNNLYFTFIARDPIELHHIVIVLFSDYNKTFSGAHPPKGGGNFKLGLSLGLMVCAAGGGRHSADTGVLCGFAAAAGAGPY